MLPKIVFLDRATVTVSLRAVRLPHAWQEYPLTGPEETIERLRDATVAITNKVTIDERILKHTPALKLIAVAATGYNVIDVDVCRARGITVCNVRDYAQTGVTEHCLMLMLALRRQLMAYRSRLMAGDWQKSPGFCLQEPALHDLKGSTLAIIGSGTLGKSLATVAKALGMHVIFADRKGADNVRPGYVSFNEALAQADVVSLHCPLIPETRELIGAAEFSKMKRSAILINTARGGIVDEAALLGALQTEQISGAGIDVLSEEPPRHRVVQW